MTSDRLHKYGPAIVLFVGALAVWEGAVRVFDIQGFILPAPSAIAATFASQWSELWPAGLGTFLSALGGLALGSVVAFLASLSAARWTAVRDGAMPLAIAANSTPIIVLAPIANAWFGLLNPFGTIAVVAVLVFFPIMINLVRGLTSAPATQVELMRSYATPSRTVLAKLQMPSALPYLFSAMKVAVALSVIGAIVKEYFGGPQDRLGQYITLKAGLFQFEEAWAAIVLASAFGILLYTVVVALERRVMPWHVSVRSAS
ncbi:MAG: ABC transporter permease [Acidimicrobiia bacterium]|nr:ABC transporter permease [Acidimicrobiia bacterium]MDH4306721.1 ABC transporter permease [Acidimicrobiia bacterium]MDH5295428.1 ABC transporter permease [Acidimicrobiia bacterium]